jgi:hypothetical protein
VGAEDKLVIREASIFQEKSVNITYNCVDATHVGLFVSVVQSAAGAEGRLLIRLASIFPPKFLRLPLLEYKIPN